jgi:hypothetical protein
MKTYWVLLQGNNYENYRSNGSFIVVGVLEDNIHNFKPVFRKVEPQFENEYLPR